MIFFLHPNKTLQTTEAALGCKRAEQQGSVVAQRQSGNLSRLQVVLPRNVSCSVFCVPRSKITLLQLLAGNSVKIWTQITFRIRCKQIALSYPQRFIFSSSDKGLIGNSIHCRQLVAPWASRFIHQIQKRLGGKQTAVMQWSLGTLNLDEHQLVLGTFLQKSAGLFHYVADCFLASFLMSPFRVPPEL